MAKTITSMWVDDELLEEAQVIADRENRSRSQILNGWLKAGYAEFQIDNVAIKAATKLATLITAKDGSGSKKSEIVPPAKGAEVPREGMRFPQWSPERFKELADAEPGGLMACSPELLKEFKEAAKTNEHVAEVLRHAGVQIPDPELEVMRKASIGVANAALDILKAPIYPPGSSAEYRDELDAAANCPDCREAKAHAYSDATTPGFFYTECEKHRKTGEDAGLPKWVGSNRDIDPFNPEDVKAWQERDRQAMEIVLTEEIAAGKALDALLPPFGEHLVESVSEPEWYRSTRVLEITPELAEKLVAGKHKAHHGREVVNERQGAQDLQETDGGNQTGVSAGRVEPSGKGNGQDGTKPSRRTRHSLGGAPAATEDRSGQDGEATAVRGVGGQEITAKALAEKIPGVGSAADLPKPKAPACKKEGHGGFWRSDGYWCAKCGKLYRESQ